MDLSIIQALKETTESIRDWAEDKLEDKAAADHKHDSEILFVELNFNDDVGFTLSHTYEEICEAVENRAVCVRWHGGDDCIHLYYAYKGCGYSDDIGLVFCTNQASAFDVSAEAASSNCVWFMQIKPDNTLSVAQSYLVQKSDVVQQLKKNDFSPISSKAVYDAIEAAKGDTDIHVTVTDKSNWNAAKTHADSIHARTDATKVAKSTTNGNIIIDGTETNVYSHPNSGATAGTYKSVTVNAQGHVTGGSNPTTLAGYGITDAEKKGTASSTVSDHNVSTSAHNDIRELISGLTDRLNALADSDDTTLDQLSEIVAYIKNNKDLIDGITTSKVNVSDIIDNLTTNITNKPLSAAQGVAIKALIDALQQNKADVSHGIHVTYSTTAPLMDGTASAGTASTVARSDHQHPTDTSRASKSDFDGHNDDATRHITATERTNWNAAKAHADSAHAPSNAEKNQNAFSNVKIGSTTIAAESATDTLTLEGSNVTITPDATNDKVTFAVTDGTTSTKGVVKLTDSTSSTSTTTAATPNSVKSAYDLANSKVDKETGKGLSSNDYTTDEKNKLAGLGNALTINALGAGQLKYLYDGTSNIEINVSVPGHKHNMSNDISGGILPAEYGGTGAASLYDARKTMNFLGAKTFANYVSANSGATDTPATWIRIGPGYTYLTTDDKKLITNLPVGTDVGCFLHNYIHETSSKTTYVYQVLYTLTSDAIVYHRHGSDTWANNGVWKAEATQDWVNTQLNKKNAFSNIAVSGQTTVAADSTADTLTFAGSNVSISTDATNDKVTFSVADATTSAKGVVKLTDSISSTSTTTAATPNSVKQACDLANNACDLANNACDLANNKVDKLPTLTDEQKGQLQSLIREYLSVNRTLFYYTGAARRESYATADTIQKTGYASQIQQGCVYEFQDSALDEKIFGTEVPQPRPYYYKYVLNCGLFCQMIWMGRPISDFIGVKDGPELGDACKSAKDELQEASDSYKNDYLLDYVNWTKGTGNIKTANIAHTLTSCPTTVGNAKKNKQKLAINSVFTTSNNTPWGYYFQFDLSRKAYRAVNKENEYYSYNSFLVYKKDSFSINGTKASSNSYTINASYGSVMAHPLINQIVVDRRFLIEVTTNIAANSDITLEAIPSSYVPSHTVALAVQYESSQQPHKILTGRLTKSGSIIVRCTDVLNEGTQFYVSVNATFSPSSEINPATIEPMGFDGAAEMAQELYVLGCEVPYSQIDVGDLVFFRRADISNDLRNKPGAEDDDALYNRNFRNIGHVGIVYSFSTDEKTEKKYPRIADCTNAYAEPIVISRSTLASTNAVDDTFSNAKAAYEQNYVVMVARHPAAFGIRGNVPDIFEPYRGQEVDRKYDPNYTS